MNVVQSNDRLSLRALLLQSLLLFLLLPFLFPGVFLRGEVIAPGDILFQLPPWSHYAPEDFVRPQYSTAVDPVAAFLPWYALSADIMRNGEWPLWNHLELGGLPLLANLQSAVFYPPRIVHLLFSLGVATTLFLLFKMWWCGMAAYLCGRGIGLRPAAASFFSVAWMLAAYNVVWCNWPLTDVAGWLPILFLGVEWTLMRRYGSAFFCLVPGGAMMVYAGHPETAFAMCLGLALYFLGRVLLDRRWGADLFKPVGVGIAAAVFAVGLCAVVLLPFAEYLPHSLAFATPPGTKTVVTLPFSSFVGFWVPCFFGSSAEENYWGAWDTNLYNMLYPGIAVWQGAFLLTTRGALPQQHRNRALALLFPAFFGPALAGSLPPFDMLHRLPPFSLMLHCHHLGFTVFALPLLAAFGLEHWCGRPRQARELWVLAVPVLVVAGSLWMLYSHFGALILLFEMDVYIKSQIIMAAVFAGAGIAVLVAGTRWTGRRPVYLVMLFTTVLAVDLIYASRGFNPTTAKDDLFPRTKLTDFLRAIEPQPRIDTAMAAIPGGFPLPYGLEQWGGYDGIYPERMMAFQQDMGIRIWRNMEPLCAISLYLNDPRYPADFPVDDPGRFTRLTMLDGVEVYKNNFAFPRAFLVGGLKFMSRAQIFAYMDSGDYDPAEFVIAQPTPTLSIPPESLRVHDPVPIADRHENNVPLPLPEMKNLRRDFAPLVGKAEVTSRTSTRVTVEAEAEQEAVLVLTDAYFPGWKATIDGQPAEIFPAYYAFRGILLPPGKHSVEYIYHPASFVWGLRITLATLAVLLVAGVLGAMRALPASAWYARRARRRGWR
jgi:hypothetical protein